MWVFYDYDEIETIVDCNFRNIPQPRNEEDEMSAEPWYPIAKNDVFPEQFSSFLLGNAKVKQYFMKHHADLLTAKYWQERKEKLMKGRWMMCFHTPINSIWGKVGSRALLCRLAVHAHCLRRQQDAVNSIWGSLKKYAPALLCRLAVHAHCLRRHA